MPYNPNGNLSAPFTGPIYRITDSLVPSANSDVLSLPTAFKFQSVKGPLFLRAPDFSEIKQSRIGDCYLLAALLSIVDTDWGKEYLNNMMCVTPANTVIVRLFHTLNPAEVNPIYVPIYFELDKTMMKYHGDSFVKKVEFSLLGSAVLGGHLAGHQAPWVYFIEKAYAAYRQRFGGECFCETVLEPYDYNGKTRFRNVFKGFRKPHNAIEALTSGWADDSFKILLAKPTEKIAIKRDNNLQSNKALVTIMQADIQGSIPFVDLDSTLQSAYKTMFAVAGDVSLHNKEQAIQAAIDDFRQYLTLDVYCKWAPFAMDNRVIRFHEINRLLTIYFYGKIMADTKFALEQYIFKNIPGKRGTGYYIASQVENYEKIHQALQTSGLVCITSDDNLGSSERDVGQAGESTAKGLTGPHVYMVLNCYERGGIKFLLICNPWKRYVREYHDKAYKYIGADGRTYTETVLSSKASVIMQPHLVRMDKTNQNMAKQFTPPELKALYARDGVFELALEDAAKRFKAISICYPHVT